MCFVILWNIAKALNPNVWWFLCCNEGKQSCKHVGDRPWTLALGLILWCDSSSTYISEYSQHIVCNMHIVLLHCVLLWWINVNYCRFFLRDYFSGRWGLSWDFLVASKVILDHCSLSGQASYHKISRIFEVSRLNVITMPSFTNRYKLNDHWYYGYIDIKQ